MNMSRNTLRASLLVVCIDALTWASIGVSAQRPPIGPPEALSSCPTEVVTLTEAAQHPKGWTPAQQLQAQLTDPSFSGTIFIPSGMTILLGETRGLEVRSCVTIKGTRSGLDPGALLVAENRYLPGSIFEVTGQYARIEGLRFRGPVATDNRDGMDHSVHAIGISGEASSVLIDNNAFEFWSVGVNVFRAWPDPWPDPATCKEKASLISITRNYFNRNAVENLGYGVGVFRGCAKIYGNLFNKNRHAVAASGYTSWENGSLHGKGYIARYNYVLEGGFTECSGGFCYWNQHFDVHGTESGGYGGDAGEYFVIASNTIRGEQTYGIDTTRAAFMLRGRAASGAYFYDNVVVHDNPAEAVRLKAGDDCQVFVGGTVQYSHDLCNLNVAPNRYDSDTRDQLAAGDFDGDGRDDVFLANGTAWWYSSAGLTEWRFLQASNLPISALRFGRFNQDARTDVLFSDGRNWWVSMGGAKLRQLQRADTTPLQDCVFGDFDGDGLTDALRADGSTWSVSSGASAPWILKQHSLVRAANLRVGDFTGDGRVDEIFWIEGNRWHLWHPTVNAVAEDVSKPVLDSDIDLLVVADFDGDRRADLAKTDGDGWIWLRGGTSVWTLLRGSGNQSEFKDIRAALLGRFTANDRRVDALRYASSRFSAESKYGFVIWDGVQDPFTPWTPGWQEMR
jgi:hypothetical protein